MESLREEWQEETERLKDRLEAAILENQYKEELLETVASQVLDFAKCHGRRLETHAHDMTTTTELLLQLSDCPEKEQTLDFLEKVLGKTSKLLNNMDSICYEREKCLRLLQLGDANDISIAETLRKRKFVVLSADEDGGLENSENLDETIDNLATDSRELQEMVKESRVDVATIRRKAKEADREIERLRLQLGVDNF